MLEAPPGVTVAEVRPRTFSPGCSQQTLPGPACRKNCLKSRPVGLRRPGRVQTLGPELAGPGANTQGRGHGGPYSPPRPGAHRKGVAPTPTRPGGSRARVPFGRSAPVSSLQKPQESQERKEEVQRRVDTHGERADDGREGKRPNRGKGGGDSRLVHHIPAVQPQLPRPKMAVARAQRPRRGRGNCRAPARPQHQLRLTSCARPPRAGRSHCAVT